MSTKETYRPISKEDEVLGRLLTQLRKVGYALDEPEINRLRGLIKRGIIKDIP